MALPPGRTATESHAIAAALDCPDRFWIAASGTAREFVLDRLVEGLRRRGERVLVLTATAAAANRLAERFLGEGTLRALAPGETLADLPPAVAEVASSVVGDGRVNAQRARLNDTIRDAGERLDRWNRVAGAWERLKAINCTCHVKPQEDPVRAEERAKAQAELPVLRQELAALAPLVSAKNAGKLFSKAYWKATFHGELIRRAGELETRIRIAEQALETNDVTPLPVKCPTVELNAFDLHCIELKSAGLTPPMSPTGEAIAEAQGAADGNRQEAEATLIFARKLLADLESDPAALAVEYWNRATIVVGPRVARTDPAIERGTFDRRVLEGAESVTHTEWEALTSANDRTILLGDFAARSDLAGERWAAAHRPQWLRESGNLVAQLVPTVAETHREPLADRPEIELRFGLTEGGDYTLASVAFPDGTTVADAKAFLAADLGEVQLVPLGPARWHSEELSVAWPLLEADDGVWIDVEPGARERVVSVDGLPATAAASFDASHWTRETAEAWVDAKSETARGRRTAELVEAVA